MRTFNYSAIKNQRWDSDILGLIASIYKEAGKQEMYLKQRPDELEHSHQTTGRRKDNPKES